MQDEQQFNQLILIYEQIKNGALDIREQIKSENYDGVLTAIKSRNSLLLNCKCIRRYLDLTPTQETQLNKLLEEIRELELENMHSIEKNMDAVQFELNKIHKSEKIQQAYGFNEDGKGSIINYSE